MPVFNLLDLCSGAGGFHLAAQLAGFEFDQTFYSDINEYANKIYKARFPASEPLGDLRHIRRSDFDDRAVPGSRWIVTAGFPCQPFSVAGSGKGVNNDRYLWHEVLRIASEFRPDFFIFENVAGIESVAFAARETRLEVRWRERTPEFDYLETIHAREEDLQLAKCLKDLEEAGATFQVFDIPALGVNAWHQRRRIWIIGSFADAHQIRSRTHGQSSDQRRSAETFGGGNYVASGDSADIDDQRCFGRLERFESGERQVYPGRGDDRTFGKPAIRESRIAGNNSDDYDAREFQPQGRVGEFGRRIGNGASPDAADVEGGGFARSVHESEGEGFISVGRQPIGSIEQNSADISGKRLERSSERGTDSREAGGRETGAYGCVGQFSGLSNTEIWQRHWVEAAAELCRSDDGLRKELDIARLRNDFFRLYPNASEETFYRALDKLETGYRKSRIELMGNSIVPQIPAEFFRIIKLIYSENL